MAAPALMTVARPGFAQTKEKITYAYLLDPAYDAVTWAMSNGKVTSDLITVEARGLAIPQLIQATSAKQYDVIMTAVIAIPPAAARGLELKVLSTALQQSPAGEGAGIWVKSDSPIKNPKELKGKSLGSYALRSTGYTQVRLALIHKYGLNAALEGGDLKQVEIQAPNLPGALAAGQIDAATLIHSQAFRALKSGEFRPIAETGRDNIETFGMRFISALNVSYPERLAQRPEAFKEFNRMFRESVRYALANRDEVFGAVGKQNNLPPEFFDWWFEKSSDVPGTFDESHAKIIMKFYELSKEIGMIQSFPDIRTAGLGARAARLMVETGIALAPSLRPRGLVRSQARRASVHAAVSSPPGRRRRWSRRPICCRVPVQVAQRLWAFVTSARDLGHLGASLFHVAAAIAISFVIGSLLALIPYYVPVLRLAIERRIGPFLNSFSAIGWTLLSIMWFGVTPLTVIFAISAVLVPFALVNMSAGLANLDPETIEMAESFTRRRARMFALVIVPSLYPFVFATLRIMFGVAWKVTLTAELFGGNSGLGYMINLARQEFDTATIFAAIILIIGFVHGMDRYVLGPLQASVSRHYAG